MPAFRLLDGWFFHYYFHANSAKMRDLKEFIESLPEKVLQTGTIEYDDKEICLRAGRFTAYYKNGALRYISAGCVELVRMIYAAVRDRNWLTVQPLVLNETLDIHEDAFRINLDCLYRNGEIEFSALYRIEGMEDGTVTFSLEGNALKQFKKNRIGICVLHPIDGCAGKECNIEHPDGSSEKLFFPESISPHQVFREIRSMTWTNGGINCRVEFEGDLFETEDQRNWTDASYKTYSTPLSLPSPATVVKNASVYQKVVFRAEGDWLMAKNEESDPIITIGLFREKALKVPSIGICRSGRSLSLTRNEVKVLRSLRFDHYRADLHLYEDSWTEKADQAANEAYNLGYDLELALFFDDNFKEEATNFRNWYSVKKYRTKAILLFHKSSPCTPEMILHEVVPFLKEANPNLRISSGTNANFAQLNRNRPDGSLSDLVCYSVHPQEHAADNVTLVENLQAQLYTVLSARSISGERGIVISPVTIQRRFNANNTFIELPWQESGVPPQVDSRLMSLFGGCWTAGSLKYLCSSGVESITYYETIGERGIMMGDSNPKWPLDFPAASGMIFPVFHVLRFLLANKSMRLIKSLSSKPMMTDCLALYDGKRMRIILVNFTGKIQSLRFEFYSGILKMRTLSSRNFYNAASNARWNGKESEKVLKSDSTFVIEPFSINFIEGRRNT